MTAAAPPRSDEEPAAVPRSRSVWRVVAGVAAWLFAAGSGAGLVVRELDVDSHLVVVPAAGAWLVLPLAVPALVLQLVRRAWGGAAVAAGLVVAQVLAYGPLFVAERPPADATTLRIVTQNLLYGKASAEDVVRHVRETDADVLAVQEFTPQAKRRLDAAGLGDLMPYRWLTPRDDATGSGLYSRLPLTDIRTWRDVGALAGSATATLPGGQRVTVMCVHPSAPFPASSTDWFDEYPRLGRVLQGLPDGPVVVAGDFNAAWDHARFRALLTGGYRDAAEQAGAGVVRTWPSDRGVALTGIDHVLTRGAVATRFATLATDRTDHRGLVVDVAVPRA